MLKIREKKFFSAVLNLDFLNFVLFSKLYTIEKLFLYIWIEDTCENLVVKKARNLDNNFWNYSWSNEEGRIRASSLSIF